jgi:hypothetical protein
MTEASVERNPEQQAEQRENPKEKEAQKLSSFLQSMEQASGLTLENAQATINGLDYDRLVVLIEKVNTSGLKTITLERQPSTQGKTPPERTRILDAFKARSRDKYKGILLGVFNELAAKVEKTNNSSKHLVVSSSRMDAVKKVFSDKSISDPEKLDLELASQADEAARKVFAKEIIDGLRTQSAGAIKLPENVSVAKLKGIVDALFGSKDEIENLQKPGFTDEDGLYKRKSADKYLSDLKEAQKKADKKEEALDIESGETEDTIYNKVSAKPADGIEIGKYAQLLELKPKDYRGRRRRQKRPERRRKKIAGRA